MKSYSTGYPTFSVCINATSCYLAADGVFASKRMCISQKDQRTMSDRKKHNQPHSRAETESLLMFYEVVSG